jgi:lipid-A-disaccharide synthase
LPDILSVRRQLLARLRALPPDVFLGVDAPDFNLGVARQVKGFGVPTVHLVSPSVWAWRPERVVGIAEAVDHMLCLFPFEPDCYKGTRVHAAYVGHPLADLVPDVQDPHGARETLRNAGIPLSRERPVLAVLPGSRRSEIKWIGPSFLAAAQELSQDFDVVIPAVSPAIAEAIRALPAWPSARQSGVYLIERIGSDSTAAGDRTRPLSHIVLEACQLAIVASGTATLEAAMFRRPMVIGYRIPAVSYWWMRRKALVQHIGLPNLLLREPLVPELVQDECTGGGLARAVRDWQESPSRMQEVADRFALLHQSLRQGCAARVSDLLQEVLWP